MVHTLTTTQGSRRGPCRARAEVEGAPSGSKMLVFAAEVADSAMLTAL
jgi:hypothetical protein